MVYIYIYIYIYIYYASKLKETLCVIASLLIKFPALSKAARSESTLFTHALRSWSGAVSEASLAPAVVLTFLKVAMAFGRSIFACTFFEQTDFDKQRFGLAHG